MSSRSKRWLVGMTIAFVLALGWLGSPDDEYPYLRKFNPIETRHSTMLFTGFEGVTLAAHKGTMLNIVEFDFKQSPSEITSRLGLHVGSGTNGAHSVRLPNRPEATYFLRAADPAKLGGVTCQLLIQETYEPWLVRTWNTLKGRLGM